MTGSDDVPTEVRKGRIHQRLDLRTSHEEADCIIVQQCYKQVIEEGCRTIRIICDDTDVISLACYFYPKSLEGITVYMEPTSWGRNVIDIGKSVRKQPDVIQYVLQLHALSGCDSVARYHGIGKLHAFFFIRMVKFFPRLDYS